MTEHHRDTMCRSVASKFGTGITENIEQISDEADRIEALENNIYLTLSDMTELSKGYVALAPNTKSNDIHHAEDVLPGGFTTQKIMKDFALTLSTCTIQFQFQWTGQRVCIEKLHLTSWSYEM